jgi:hypothetical protein
MLLLTFCCQYVSTAYNFFIRDRQKFVIFQGGAKFSSRIGFVSSKYVPVMRNRTLLLTRSTLNRCTMMVVKNYRGERKNLKIDAFLQEFLCGKL